MTMSMHNIMYILYNIIISSYHDMIFDHHFCIIILNQMPLCIHIIQLKLDHYNEINHCLHIINEFCFIANIIDPKFQRSACPMGQFKVYSV